MRPPSLLLSTRAGGPFEALAFFRLAALAFGVPFFPLAPFLPFRLVAGRLPALGESAFLLGRRSPLSETAARGGRRGGFGDAWEDEDAEGQE